MKNVSPEFTVDHLEIGNRPENRNPVRRLSFFVEDALRLGRRLGKNDYDLVHINPSLEILSLLRDSFYIFLISRIHKTRSLVVFHGWNQEIAVWIAACPILRSIFRSLYGKAGRVLALCTLYKDQLERMGLAPKQVEVITTMYEADEACYGNSKKDSGAPIQILFMARLWRSKGVYIAVDVARLLVESGVRNFRLVIAGDGPELEGVRRRREEIGLTEFVLIPGYLKDDEKRAVLERSDIFLYPTYYGEGCPVGLLEAMGAGLAIVSTPVAAIPEVVKGGQNGFLVDSRKAEDFYPSVKRLMDDPALLGRIRAANKAKALENYEARVVTRKIESIYASIIQDLPAKGGKRASQGDRRGNAGMNRGN
jgi:glycosyltransferase involved in cell wall biosynthesis